MALLKVTKLEDESWVFETKIWFPGWHSNYEDLEAMPTCIKDKIILLGHAPVSSIQTLEGIGHRSASNIFWVYLTKQEVDNVSGLTLSE